MVLFEVLFLSCADEINNNISKLGQIFKQVSNYRAFIFFLLNLKNKTKEYLNSNQIHAYESNLEFENELLNIQEVKEEVLIIKKIKY